MSKRDWSSDVCSSDLLVTRTSGHSTVSVAEELLFARVVEASFVAATVTVFGRVPQSAAVVARDRVIVRVARSEERRVGKECRSGWTEQYEEKEKAKVR